MLTSQVMPVLNSFAWIGSQELIIVMVIVLVLFGGKKIPELMKGVGRGVGELQKGLDEGRRGLADDRPAEKDRPLDARTDSSS
jgi:sec-independent protein translocase protein TatA